MRGGCGAAGGAWATPGRRAGMLLVETAGEVSQQPRRGLDVLALIGALEGRQYPGPLTLRQMVEDVAGLVDLDDMFVKIQRREQYLWRAVDEDRDVSEPTRS